MPTPEAVLEALRPVSINGATALFAISLFHHTR